MIWDSATAEEGSRTLKVLLPHGPEPCASANSATSAFAVFLTRHTLFYTIFPKCQVFFVFLFSFFPGSAAPLQSAPSTRPEPGSFSFRFSPPLFRQIPAPKAHCRQSGNRTRRTSVRKSKRPVSFRKQAFLYNAGGGT